MFKYIQNTANHPDFLAQYLTLHKAFPKNDEGCCHNIEYCYRQISSFSETHCSLVSGIRTRVHFTVLVMAVRRCHVVLQARSEKYLPLQSWHLKQTNAIYMLDQFQEMEKMTSNTSFKLLRGKSVDRIANHRGDGSL